MYVESRKKSNKSRPNLGQKFKQTEDWIFHLSSLSLILLFLRGREASVEFCGAWSVYTFPIAAKPDFVIDSLSMRAEL